MVYTIEAAINRGVEVLNRHSPHWFTLIDLARLDIAICTDCIVGQVFGSDDFGGNLRKLGVDTTYEASDYGFDVDDDEYNAEELEAAWRHRIEWMREDAPASIAAARAGLADAYPGNPGYNFG